MQRSPALLLWLRTLGRSCPCTQAAPAVSPVASQAVRSKQTSTSQQQQQQQQQPGILQQPSALSQHSPDPQNTEASPGAALISLPALKTRRQAAGIRDSTDTIWDQIAEHTTLPGDEDLPDTLQLYRRHNTSLPILEGQMILCRVLSVSRQSLLLDTGDHCVFQLIMAQPRSDISWSRRLE